MAKELRFVIAVINCENFIYALFPDLGYKLLKSPKVDRLLSKENIQYLCHIGDGLTEDAYVQVLFASEKVLSVSCLSPIKDKFNRDGIFNHTILITLEDYVKLTRPDNLLSSYFIRQLNEPPSNPLDTIRIEEK